MDLISEDNPVLIGQTGPLNGQRWILKGSLVVGRDPTCDIVIPSRQVSRQHIRLTQSDKGFQLEDLDSKNGTHYNGKSVKETVWLKDGDIIQVAFAQQFAFLSSDATLPLDMTEGLEPIPQAKTDDRLKLDKRSRRVWIGDEEVTPPLSLSQFQLLEILNERKGQVVPRKEVIARIWGEEDAVGVSEQALDALVRRLRDRLALIDPSHPYIVTIRGHGLRLDNPEKRG